MLECLVTGKISNMFLHFQLLLTSVAPMVIIGVSNVDFNYLYNINSKEIDYNEKGGKYPPCTTIMNR